MAKKYNGKTVVGLIEKVTIVAREGDKQNILAKIDTGASKSSIDLKLAGELKLGPVIKSKLIKSAHGNKVRPIIEAEIILEGKRLKEEFTLADRSHMKYAILIGQNVLKHDFLIDPLLK